MNDLEALWHWILRGLGIEDADPAPAVPLQLPPGHSPRLTQAPGGPLTILSPVAPGDVHVVDDDPIVAPAYKFLTSPAWGAPERAALLTLQRGLGLDPNVGGLAGVIQHETGGVPNLPTDAQIAAERTRSGGKSTPRGGLTQITVGAHVPGYDTAEKVRAIRAMPIATQLAAGGPIDLYWRGQMPRGPGADQSTRHLLRLNFLPALASAPTSTVLGVAAGKVGPGGEKPEDVIPGGLTKGAIYAANPVFDGPKRGYFTWADVDGQATTPPGWVTVSGRVLSTLPAGQAPAPDLGAGTSGGAWNYVIQTATAAAPDDRTSDTIEELRNVPSSDVPSTDASLYAQRGSQRALITRVRSEILAPQAIDRYVVWDGLFGRPTNSADLGAAHSSRPSPAPLGETPSQAHASGRWQIEHALGHRLGPAGPDAADLGAGSTPDVTSVIASALDGSATVEPPASPISLAQCSRGLVLPPVTGAVPWVGDPNAAIQAWASSHLSHGIGTVIRDTVGGVPVVGRVECHSYYGADPSKPSAPHKGVTLYRPTGAAPVAPAAKAATYAQAPVATPAQAEPTAPTAPAAPAAAPAKVRGKARKTAPAAPPTPAQPEAPLDAPEPEDPAPDAPEPAPEGLQDPPEDTQLVNGLRASASTSGVDMGAARSIAALRPASKLAIPPKGPAKVNSPAGAHHDATHLPNGQPLPPGACYNAYSVVVPCAGMTPPWPGAHWNNQSGTWTGGTPPASGSAPTTPGTSGPTVAPTLHRGANGQWLNAAGQPVSVTGTPVAGAPSGGGAAPPGYANEGGGRWGSAQGGYPPDGGQSYSYPSDGSGYGGGGVDPAALLGLLQAVQQSPVSDAPTYSGGLDPSDVLALLTQQQKTGAATPDLSATLQGYLDQGGNPSALAALLQPQGGPDPAPDMGAAFDAILGPLGSDDPASLIAAALGLAGNGGDLGLALDRDYIDPIQIIRRGIIPAWLENSTDPVTWVPLNVGGYQLQVMSEPASVRGMRLPTSLDTLVKMGGAVEGGAIPITPAISDARWQQAAERIPGAEWHTTDPRGATGDPQQVIAFNQHLPPPSTVLRDGYGKEFVLTPTLKPEGAGSGVQYGWRWPDGKLVQKGLGGPHNRAHGDYSDLGTLVKLGALDPQGQPVNLLDVLAQDSALSPALKPWLIERLRAATSGGGGFGA